jgi:L-alanine-DL-glutamate epimerase-like enolase superfamily enzyme
MKITDLRVTKLEVSGPRWADAVSILEKRTCLILEVDTDAGITGIAEMSSMGDRLMQDAIDEIKPMLVGENPAMIERIWDKMYRRLFTRARRGPITCAMSAVDIALWDINGKDLGRPVYQLLGGYRDRVRSYASGGFYQEGKGPDGLAREAQGYVDRGFTAMKMKIGRQPHELLVGSDWCRTGLAEDIERVRAVREVLGPDRALAVDINRCWDVPTSIKMGRRLEEFDLAWIEEPVSTDDVAGSARIAAALDTPISGYETELSWTGFREMIERGAIDIVQPDVFLTGGFTECRRIATMAWAAGLPIVPHAFSSIITTVANLHLLAAIPNGGMLEYCQYPGPLQQELILDRPEIQPDGSVAVPNKPGLGIELNRKVIARLKV